MLTLSVANPTHEYTLTASERYISRKKLVGTLGTAHSAKGAGRAGLPAEAEWQQWITEQVCYHVTYR